MASTKAHPSKDQKRAIVCAVQSDGPYFGLDRKPQISAWVKSRFAVSLPGVCQSQGAV